MRVAISVLLTAGLLGAAQAQVIKGESTDDAAYAPRPAARWHSPESQGAVPDDQRGDDVRDQGVRAERPRD